MIAISCLSIHLATTQSPKVLTFLVGCNVGFITLDGESFFFQDENSESLTVYTLVFLRLIMEFVRPFRIQPLLMWLMTIKRPTLRLMMKGQSMVGDL